MLPGNARAQSVAAGEYHACATTVDARVFCWGRNHPRQTGALTGAMLRTPVEVALPAGMVPTLVHTGALTTCTSATTAGDLYCWGSNVFGGLGVGDYIDSPWPRKVQNPAP